MDFWCDDLWKVCELRSFPAADLCIASCWGSGTHIFARRLMIRLGKRAFRLHHFTKVSLNKVILCRLVSVFFCQKRCWSSCSFYGTRLKTRYWQSGAVVRKSSENPRYSVIRRPFLLPWCYVSAGALPRGAFVALCEWSGCAGCFFRLLFQCGRQIRLRSDAFECGGQPAGIWRVEYQVSRDTGGLSLCPRCCYLIYEWCSLYPPGRVVAPGSDDFFFNDPLRCSAKILYLQVKYDRLLAQLSSINSECDSWRSIAQERDTKVISLWLSFASSNDELKLLESQILFILKEKRLSDLSRTRKNLRVNRLRALLSRYRGAFCPVLERLNYESLCLKASLEEAENQGEGEVNHVLHSLILF